MATRNAVISPAGLKNGTVQKVVWALSTTNDVGMPAVMPEFHAVSVQITGTFGLGNSVVLEGSNDGVNYYSLTTPAGATIAWVGSGLAQVVETVEYIRPRAIGTPEVVVTLLGRRIARVRD